MFEEELKITRHAWSSFRLGFILPKLAAFSSQKSSFRNC